MTLHRTPIEDEISRTIRNASLEPLGKITLRYHYVEVFDDGQDGEDAAPRYVVHPFSRELERYDVIVAGPDGAVQSSTTLTGEAMRQLVELSIRLEPDANKR